MVHEELGHLPQRYREAVVLCLLEGLTPEQAARHLNCPVGTVHSRLARGRSILAKRLARRGFAVAIVAVALADGAVSACVSCELVVSTVTAACLSVAEGAAAKALLSARVITLTQGVLQSMVLTKVKIAIAVLLVLGIAALGADRMISRTRATEPAGNAGRPGKRPGEPGRPA